MKYWWEITNSMRHPDFKNLKYGSSMNLSVAPGGNIFLAGGNKPVWWKSVKGKARLVETLLLLTGGLPPFIPSSPPCTSLPALPFLEKLHRQIPRDWQVPEPMTQQRGGENSLSPQRMLEETPINIVNRLRPGWGFWKYCIYPTFRNCTKTVLLFEREKRSILFYKLMLLYQKCLRYHFVTRM